MSYEFKHSIEVNINKESAWNFWTEVENWKLDPIIEAVNLDGSFEAGKRGTTKMRGADIIQWQIAQVTERESATIEIPTPGMAARFHWRFEELSDARTKLTQQITLKGEHAQNYAAEMGAGFEQGVRDGMEKLCAAMEQTFGNA
jgi:Polyketide cyclase / dehydrase and lipid transport